MNEEDKQLNQLLVEKLSHKHLIYTAAAAEYDRDFRVEPYKGHTRAITMTQMD